MSTLLDHLGVSPKDDFNFKNMFKKIGQGFKNLGQFAGKEAKQAGKGLKNLGEFAAKSVIDVALFVPLLPFRVTMKKMLEQKGVKTAHLGNEDLITRFYNEFVSKKARPQSKSSFEELPSDFFDTHPSKFCSWEDYADADSDTKQNILGMLPVVVQEIVSFFKTLIAKKKSGKPMSNTEDTGASGAEDVQETLENKAKGELPVTKSAINNIFVIVLILIVLGAIIYKTQK